MPEPIPSLSEINLSMASLNDIDLSKVDLTRADLGEANLVRANLGRANLSEARLNGAMLNTVDLSGANLTGANLGGANLSGANLTGAILRRANLCSTNFNLAILRGCDFETARAGWSLFPAVDLSNVQGLDTVEHIGPSSIGTETLAVSEGRISEAFLRECGLSPWEVINARLYNPRLSALEICDLQNEIFARRTCGPLYIGGIFISYSWNDRKFVDKLHSRLKNEEARVYLDRHDLVAGPLEKQIDRAIRLNDTVLLVLSKTSIESDFVLNELEMARRKEKEEHRQVVCPIALDDAWKKKWEPGEANRVLWLTLKEKNILDFSKWGTKVVFESAYRKLIDGLKTHYPTRDTMSRDPGSCPT